MKFIMQQNNERMLKVYSSWTARHMDGELANNLPTECANVDFLVEIIFKSTGVRCHERIKRQSNSTSDNIQLILDELRLNKCPIDDHVTPTGLVTGELDSVLGL